LADLLDNQIVLIIDLLGFTESTSCENSPLQGHVLSLLKHIASMRSDFDLNATVKADWGAAHDITLAVSTFSDHIVISVPFDRIRSTEGLGDFAGAVAGLVGIEGGVVSGVINLESSGVEASDWRPRHDEHYHEV
jgi:hypothetical protein